MNKTQLILLLLWLPFSALSQRTIKGNVINATTGTPLAGSSVFLSNTSIGTTSDKTGYFELRDIPAGRYDLIVSSVGYETNVYSFGSEQLPLQVKVQMTIKVKELENVTVEPYVEEGWDKWGATFMREFIGGTPNAKHCKIKNQKAIHFRYYKKRKRLIAYSDEPIVIENKALGYTINYQLEEFEIDFSQGSSSYAGYPYFEEIDKSRKGLQNRWKAAREKAYYGSIMHFMRCLYRDSLAQNGYEVRRMMKLPNLEKRRVQTIYRSLTKMSYDSIKKQSVVKLDMDKLPKDTQVYYQRILREEDYKDIYGTAMLGADSLLTNAENGQKYLFFPDYLYITYKGEPEEEAYLLFSGENRTPVFQRSYLLLVNQQAVALDMNGNYYPPQQLYSLAYWGWSEKNSDLLPQDYRP